MQAANDNVARSAITGEPLHIPMDKEAAADRSLKEKAAMRIQKKRLGKRAKIGADWDGKADNDNIAWPLAKALLAEGNGDLLKYAMSYRKIYNTAKSEVVLGGSGVVMREGFSLDRHTVVRANGTIAYKHIRQSKAAHVDIPGKQYVPPYDDEQTETHRNSIRIPKPWNGDKPVNDRIDAEAQLIRLQSRLGHLCEPFEMACIDGATLAEVGNSVGIANRSGAQGAGRALVHMALITIRDSLGEVVRRDLAA